jgi:tetratricopeptide (TPR) repeat protein
LAVPDTHTYRLGKFVRRHPLGLVAGFLLVLSLVAVQAAFQRARQDKRLAETVLSLMRDTFEGADPYGMRGRQLKPIDILRSGEAAIKKEILREDRARLLDIIGVSFKNLGQYEDAIRVLSEALTIRQDLFGSEHLEVAASLNHLGVTFWRNDQLGKAESLLEESLEQRRNLPNTNAEELSDGLSSLGLVLVDRNRTSEARELYEEALEVLEGAPSDLRVSKAAVLNNFGLLLEKIEMFELATDYHRRALALRQGEWPGGHALVGDSLNNLGVVLRKLKNYPEAETVLRSTMKMWRETLGEGHPRLAHSLNNLGVVLHKRSNKEVEILKEARRSLMEAVEIQEATFKDGLLDTITILSNLAGIEDELGEYDASEVHWLQALEIHGRLAPDDKRWLARLKTGLANSIGSKKEHIAAKQHFLEIADIYRTLDLQKKLKITMDTITSYDNLIASSSPDSLEQ